MKLLKMEFALFIPTQNLSNRQEYFLMTVIW